MIPANLFANRPIVYIAWGWRNECLYVGMSCCGLNRPAQNRVLRANGRRVARLEVLVCRDREGAKQLEHEKICELRPKLVRLWYRRWDSSMLVNRYGIARGKA